MHHEFHEQYDDDDYYYYYYTTSSRVLLILLILRIQLKLVVVVVVDSMAAAVAAALSSLEPHCILYGVQLMTSSEYYDYAAIFYCDSPNSADKVRPLCTATVRSLGD